MILRGHTPVTHSAYPPNRRAIRTSAASAARVLLPRVRQAPNSAQSGHPRQAVGLLRFVSAQGVRCWPGTRRWSRRAAGHANRFGARVVTVVGGAVCQPRQQSCRSIRTSVGIFRDQRRDGGRLRGRDRHDVAAAMRHETQTVRGILLERRAHHARQLSAVALERKQPSRRRDCAICQIRHLPDDLESDVCSAGGCPGDHRAAVRLVGRDCPDRPYVGPLALARNGESAT